MQSTNQPAPLYSVYPEPDCPCSWVQWTNSNLGTSCIIYLENEYIEQYGQEPNFTDMLNERYGFPPPVQIWNDPPFDLDDYDDEQLSPQALAQVYGMVRDEDGNLEPLSATVELDTHHDVERTGRYPLTTEVFQRMEEMWVMRDRDDRYDCEICGDNDIRLRRRICIHTMCMGCVIKSFTTNGTIPICPYCRR